MKRPTLIDVGREAGVSAITVSRALREPEKVSKALRDRISKAIDKLGYVPNPAAASLASNRSSIIAVLVPSFSNNVFSDVLSGTNAVLEKTGYSIQIANTGYNPIAEEGMIRKFVSLSPAGVIIAGVDQTAASRKMLKDVDCPVVQIMDITDDPVDVIVGFSNFDAAATSVEHMVAQGYRRIAFVGTRMDPRTQQRMAGYEAVMRKHQLYDASLFITTPQKSSVEIGRHLLAGLLDKVPDCDGVFCNNDDVAVGIALECQRRNLAVPEAFGICGFNDLGTTSQMNPAITSVYTPRVEIGERAAQYIIDRNAGHPKPEVRNIDLGFTLKVRASTLRTGTG